MTLCVPQGMPTRVMCGPSEDCGVALALAGALALQATILALQAVGGLLRGASGVSGAAAAAVRTLLLWR